MLFPFSKKIIKISVYNSNTYIRNKYFPLSLSLILANIWDVQTPKEKAKGEGKKLGQQFSKLFGENKSNDNVADVSA